MKKSMVVTLVISGALLTGCNDNPPPGGANGDYSQSLTNNTYRSGYGYWHAPYHSWYPYPYNSYWPGRGYYFGGRYGDSADNSPIKASSPYFSSSSGGGSGSSFSGSSSGGNSEGSAASVSRGGFGSSGHSASS